MGVAKKKVVARARPASVKKPVTAAEAVAALQRLARKQTRDGMARYAIPSEKAFGVPVGQIRALAKRFGRSHELAQALWKTGHYEARMLATFVDEVERVTPKQMDRWCRDFDSWAICDTACFALFDRSPHAIEKVRTWAASDREFVKRAAFALLASLTVHDKSAKDADFMRLLPLVERGAQDERNFVKKAVNWALRSLGKRSPALHRAAVVLARRLAQQSEAAPRWVGKDALRELTGASVARRLSAKKARKAGG